MIKSWNEDIKSGSDLERYIRTNALEPNLGNMDSLVETVDEVNFRFLLKAVI